MDGYLNGDLSSEELELLQQWYDSFGESVSGVPGMEDDATAKAIKDELDVHIRQTVNTASIETRSMPILKTLRWMAVAGVLIAVFGSVIWMSVKSQHGQEERVKTAQYQTFQEVKTGIKQIKKLVLPDGTIIHVNANSVIRIPAHKGHKKREVFLDEGEAHFDVARDSMRPFIVQAQALRVEVLGTAFDIKSYKALKDVKVAVKRGRVRVSDTKRILGELVANKGIIYSKLDENARMVNITVADADAWIGGVVRLEKAGFDELALALYNLHGVHLRSKDPRTLYNHYNLSLHSDRSLQEMMDVICSIHHTNYRRKGDEITIYP